MIIKCCVCEKIRRGDLWIRPSRSFTTEEPISHTYCPKCADTARAEFQRQAILITHSAARRRAVSS